MAVITTSGSMPFPLASASMVWCNGFDSYYSGVPPGLSCPSELHFQMCSGNDPDWHQVSPPVLRLDDHSVAVDAAEPPLEKRLAVDRLAHHQLGAASGEPPIIVGSAQ